MGLPVEPDPDPVLAGREIGGEPEGAGDGAELREPALGEVEPVPDRDLCGVSRAGTLYQECAGAA